jgi:hypothetical protein
MTSDVIDSSRRDTGPYSIGSLASEISGKFDRMLHNTLGPVYYWLSPIWKQLTERLLSPYHIDMPILELTEQLMSRLYLPHISEINLSTEDYLTSDTPTPFSWFDRRRQLHSKKDWPRQELMMVSIDKYRPAHFVANTNDTDTCGLETYLPAEPQGEFSDPNDHRADIYEDYMIPAIHEQKSMAHDLPVPVRYALPLDLSLAKALGNRANAEYPSISTAEYSGTWIDRDEAGSRFHSIPNIDPSDGSYIGEQSRAISAAKSEIELILPGGKSNGILGGDENSHRLAESGPFTETPESTGEEETFEGIGPIRLHSANRDTVPELTFTTINLNYPDRSILRPSPEITRLSTIDYSSLPRSYDRITVANAPETRVMPLTQGEGDSGLQSGRAEVNLALAPISRSLNTSTAGSSEIDSKQQAQVQVVHTNNGQAVDTESLSLEVYEILKRRLLIERERSQ